MAKRGRPPFKGTLKLNTQTHQEDDNRSRFEMTRDSDRISREVETRERNDLYDLPDVDAFNPEVHAQRLQLVAPPPRIHEKFGKLRQHWVAFKHNNGHRVQQLLDIGYVIRHPNTVPPGFKHFTEKWNGNDVIMVGGDHILMETSESNWKKIQDNKTRINRERLQSIRQQHGQVIRDGEIQDFRLAGAGSFSQEIIVNSNNGNGEGDQDVSFAD